MSKHTDGPWKIKYLPPMGFVPPSHEIQYGEDGECVAERVCSEDDANLIAAAPELLEALEGVEKYLVERGIERKGTVGRTIVLPAIKKAIAKARGE